MIHTKLARARVLSSKALHAAPRVIANPRHLVYAARGVHWATLTMVDVPWLRQLGVRTVIDVGANTGQFASASRVVFPAARIYSFEPIPDCFNQLNRRMLGVKDFEAFNVAIGSNEGEAPFFHNAFPESSSLLEMSRTHSEAFPWTGESTTTTVHVRTLDSFLPDMSLIRPLLLKIDVQGFEEAVLTGASRTLLSTDVVLIEVSFMKLYAGEPSFDQIQHLMKQSGFVLAGFLDQLNHPATGQPLQGDAIYLRPEAMES